MCPRGLHLCDLPCDSQMLQSQVQRMTQESACCCKILNKLTSFRCDRTQRFNLMLFVCCTLTRLQDF